MGMNQTNETSSRQPQMLGEQQCGTKVRGARDDERGALTVEACVAVCIFSLFALFLWSMLPMHMAQNAVAHALLQTTESLALDAYAAEQIRMSGVTSINSNITNYASWSLPSDDKFTTDKVWYRRSGTDEYFDPQPAVVIDAVKTRFENYLGTNRSKSATDYLAGTLVAGGLDGLDFTGTCVKDKVLYVTVSYTYHDQFGLWSHLGMEPLEACQSACSRLWIE